MTVGQKFVDFSGGFSLDELDFQAKTGSHIIQKFPVIGKGFRWVDHGVDGNFQEWTFPGRPPQTCQMSGFRKINCGCIGIIRQPWMKDSNRMIRQMNMGNAVWKCSLILGFFSWVVIH